MSTDDSFDWDDEDGENEESDWDPADPPPKMAAPEDRTGQIVSRVLEKLERDAVARRNMGRVLAKAPPLLERYLALTHIQGPTTLVVAARDLRATPEEVKNVVVQFLVAAEDILEEE